MRVWLHSLFLAGALMIGAAPAWSAEATCVPLSALTKSLAEGRFHESPVARANVESGVMLIVYAAADGATWTLVGVRAGRPEIGCLLGAGTDWQPVTPPPPGKAS